MHGFITLYENSHETLCHVCFFWLNSYSLCFLFISILWRLKCHILFQESVVSTFLPSQLLCRCILEDLQNYFTAKSKPIWCICFWIHVHKRSTSFYTVVYVNNVHITVSVRIRRYTPMKEKYCSFAKRKTFFIMYISMCFYTKKVKKKIC